MSRWVRLFVLAASLASVVPSGGGAQTITRPPDGDNQRASVSQWIGLVQVTVDYHSPDVHGPGGEDRAGHIWGELVPYGLTDLGFNNCTSCPWRAGANENTTISFSHDVRLQGQPIPAGRYGLHMIADKEEWTLVLSKNSTSWGSYSYDPAEDALRVKVKPRANEYREWLTYEFTDRRPDRTTCELQWERLAVPFTVSVPNIQDLYVQRIRDEMRGEASFTWVNWERAARYCLANKTHLDQGLVWAQGAVSNPNFGTANFTTLTTLAQLQIANGKRVEASANIDKAVATSGLTAVAVHGFARQLQGQGEKDLALKVFQLNARRFPNQWPVNLGLARGHADTGDKARAIGYARLALKQAPDEPNRKNVEGLIRQWSAPAGK